MEQPDEISPEHIRAQVAALRYLVLMLLQRLDADGYASIAEIAARVKHDWQRLDPGLPDHALVEATFRETMTILKTAAGKS